MTTTLLYDIIATSLNLAKAWAMEAFKQRRFHRLHERFLLSPPFLLALGWTFAVFLPFLALWSWEPQGADNGQKMAMLVTSLAYLASHGGLSRLRSVYPGGRFAQFIAPQVLITYGAFALITYALHLNIPKHLLLVSYGVALVWLYIEYTFTFKYLRLKLGVIPGGRYTQNILDINFIDARPLSLLKITGCRYDGIVADLENVNDANTLRFLTQCALNHIPVYDAKQIYESLTGRVKIHHISENNIGSLLPSPTYELSKLVFDLFILLVTAPLTIPIALVTAVLIKMESPGPIIYTQTRIGRGNKPFTIYKFRSMRFDRQAKEQFAGEDDPRITKVGKVIRKLRIDELPQFINILKGDMSLIGPRPEQPTFVQEYNDKIPFYAYRHIVKPGITGWAQVRHGYTANVNETQVKIEHDFYYIKNCSLTLDLIIAILTVRIIFTGFGAR